MFCISDCNSAICFSYCRMIYPFSSFFAFSSTTFEKQVNKLIVLITTRVSMQKWMIIFLMLCIFFDIYSFFWFTLVMESDWSASRFCVSLFTYCDKFLLTAFASLTFSLSPNVGFFFSCEYVDLNSLLISDPKTCDLPK